MSSPNDLSTLPFAQQQRIRFIESTLLWEGSIQRQRVCDVFHVNANHVTKDFHVYRERFAKGLEYNPTTRAYEPGVKFRPVLANGDPAEYLSFLLAYAQSQSVTLLPVLGSVVVPAEAIPAPKLVIDRKVLQQVILAIKQGRAIRVQYFSISSGEDMKRTLWPHALFYTGTYWHLRAFDGRRREFRNFAIQRIGEIEADSSASPVDVADDKGWHEYETAEIVPNPKFNQHQKAVVAREFGMRGDGATWIWTERVRRCLVGYFVINLRLDLDEGAGGRPQVVLRNKRDLKKFFFAAEE